MREGNRLYEQLLNRLLQPRGGRTATREDVDPVYAFFLRMVADPQLSPEQFMTENCKCDPKENCKCDPSAFTAVLLLEESLSRYRGAKGNGKLPDPVASLGLVMPGHGFRFYYFIGGGGQGQVFYARRESGVPKEVAIKAIYPTRENQALVDNEIDCSNRIADHNHVVRFLYSAENAQVPGAVFAVMDFVHGVSLDRLLPDSDSPEGLPWREVVELGVQACTDWRPCAPWDCTTATSSPATFSSTGVSESATWGWPPRSN